MNLITTLFFIVVGLMMAGMSYCESTLHNILLKYITFTKSFFVAKNLNYDEKIPEYDWKRVIKYRRGTLICFYGGVLVIFLLIGFNALFHFS